MKHRSVDLKSNKKSGFYRSPTQNPPMNKNSDGQLEAQSNKDKSDSFKESYSSFHEIVLSPEDKELKYKATKALELAFKNAFGLKNMVTDQV
jgi:hypothetical protein